MGLKFNSISHKVLQPLLYNYPNVWLFTINVSTLYSFQLQYYKELIQHELWKDSIKY